jgi:thiamine pyrophosphate-dependent acetolactate synthase large subunit-like protein
MLMADFTTAVRERLPVRVVLFNDGKLKNIAKEQHIAGFPPYAVDLRNPNFAAFAATAGGLGIRVEDAEALAPAVEQALAYDGPALVEVMVDPAVTALPAALALTTTDGAPL